MDKPSSGTSDEVTQEEPAKSAESKTGMRDVADYERQRQILRTNHKRQISELGETGPGLECWRKRSWNIIRAISGRSSGATPAPSLDDAVNLLGLAPKNCSDGSGALASELGLLVYSSQPDESKKLMIKAGLLAKEQAKEKKEAIARAVEAAAAAKASAAAEKKANAGSIGDSKSVDNPERRRTRRRDTQHHQEQVAVETKDEEEEGDDEDEDGDEEDDADDWVQCEKCDKWRRLPPKTHPNYPRVLAEKWNCNMNNWDELAKSCSDPEESVNKKELTQVGAKIRIWLRRLKSNDKYAKMYANNHGDGSRDSSMATRGVTDWIRCSNSKCGKWRACLRSMSAKVVLDRYPNWTCWMNSWDETRASCTAPQEGMCVRSLAEVELAEQHAMEEDRKLAEREAKAHANGTGRPGTMLGGNVGLPSKANDDDDEIEYTRGVSQRGRIVRSRWTAQARRRFLGK